MATHPPLEKRILAIDPSWDGAWAEPVGAVYPSAVAGAAGFAGGVPSERLVAAVDDAAQQVGEPREAHREYAAQLLESIPMEVSQAAREPYGARAVLYALLLDEDRAVRQRQYDELREIAEPDVIQLMLKILPSVDSIDTRVRLPLVDLSLPALAKLSPRQYQRFSRAFRSLVLADERLSLFEWVLSQVLLRHLRPRFEAARSVRVDHYSLLRLNHACEVVLSAIAWSGHRESDPRIAFREASEVLSDLTLEFLPRESCGLDELRKALEQLRTVSAKQRGRIIEAAAEAICADYKVSVAEAELLRGISDLLDCPMPPLLAGQEVGT